MRVILIEDVPKLGNAGEVVRVKPGYGRNYLIPQGIAQLATDRRVKQLEHHQRVIAEKVKRQVKGFEDLAKQVRGAKLAFEMQSNAEGKLFGSVTNADIQQQLAEQGLQIDRRKIELGEPIKQVGEHEVTIRLHREVLVDLKVDVTSSAIVADAIEEQSDADAQMDAAEVIAAADERGDRGFD